MRSVFFDSFKALHRENESLFFLTAATGYNLVETIFDEAPMRALNVGIAEQNMIGIASGLSNLGFLPICYGLTNFLVERSFEQIRNDICLNQNKVILIGTSTGYDQGALGPTHHKLDDIGALKALPNLRIYSPSGQKSMSVILKEVLEEKHSSFIRIPKGNLIEKDKIKSPNHFIFEIDSPLLVISHGKMVSNAVLAYKKSPNFSLYAMDRIKPLDPKVLSQLFESFRNIVVLEDNFRSGLYNSICQWSIEESAAHKNIVSIAPEEFYDDILGDTEYLEEKHGLSPSKIEKKINELLSIER